MTYVTFGGVTVGICILLATLVRWSGRKALMKRPHEEVGALLPFLLAWAYGVLAILTVGGIVGWVADSALWISNWLGDAALVWGVGGEVGQQGAATRYVPLTGAGNGIVLIFTVAMVVARKKSAQYGRDLTMGMWCGVCLGTSAGVAGFAAVPLATAVNVIGQHTYGAF
jgi:hypothetical protein